MMNYEQSIKKYGCEHTHDKHCASWQGRDMLCNCALGNPTER